MSLYSILGGLLAWYKARFSWWRWNLIQAVFEPIGNCDLLPITFPLTYCPTIHYFFKSKTAATTVYNFIVVSYYRLAVGYLQRARLGLHSLTIPWPNVTPIVYNGFTLPTYMNTEQWHHRAWSTKVIYVRHINNKWVW